MSCVHGQNTHDLYLSYYGPTGKDDFLQDIKKLRKCRKLKSLIDTLFLWGKYGLIKLERTIFFKSRCKLKNLQTLNIMQYSYGSNSNMLKSNNLLLQLPTRQQNQCYFFVPSFLRLQIKRINSLSLNDLKGQFGVTIKLDFDVTDLPAQMVKILRNNLKLFYQFQNQSCKVHQSSNITCKERQKLGKDGKVRKTIGYRIKRSVSLRIVPQLFWTPFEQLIMILSISIEHIQLWQTPAKLQFMKHIVNNLSPQELRKGKFDDNYESVGLKFNIMDFKYRTWYYDENDKKMKDGQAKIMYGDETYFGNYDLAERLFKVSYTNKENCEKFQQISTQRNSQNTCCHSLIHSLPCNSDIDQQLDEEESEKLEYSNKQDFKIKQGALEKYQGKIQPFQHAHFEITLYRIPIASLFSTFAPFWILGIISLVIYFEVFKLSTRVGGISMVMMSFVANIPNIRSKLPPSPHITFIQILNYFSIFVAVLCLIQSFINKGSEDKFNEKSNPFFIISFTIIIVQFVIILWMIIFYNCYRKPRYNIERGMQFLLAPEQWENKPCDEYFNNKANIPKQNGKLIEIVQYKKDRNHHGQQRGNAFESQFYQNNIYRNAPQFRNS